VANFQETLNLIPVDETLDSSPRKKNKNFFENNPTIKEENAS